MSNNYMPNDRDNPDSNIAVAETQIKLEKDAKADNANDPNPDYWFPGKKDITWKGKKIVLIKRPKGAKAL